MADIVDLTADDESALVLSLRAELRAAAQTAATAQADAVTRAVAACADQADVETQEAVEAVEKEKIALRAQLTAATAEGAALQAECKAAQRRAETAESGEAAARAALEEAQAVLAEMRARAALQDGPHAVCSGDVADAKEAEWASERDELQGTIEQLMVKQERQHSALDEMAEALEAAAAAAAAPSAAQGAGHGAASASAAETAAPAEGRTVDPVELRKKLDKERAHRTSLVSELEAKNRALQKRCTTAEAQSAAGAAKTPAKFRELQVRFEELKAENLKLKSRLHGEDSSTGDRKHDAEEERGRRAGGGERRRERTRSPPPASRNDRGGGTRRSISDDDFLTPPSGTARSAGPPDTRGGAPSAGGDGPPARPPDDCSLQDLMQLVEDRLLRGGRGVPQELQVLARSSVARRNALLAAAGPRAAEYQALNLQRLAREDAAGAAAGWAAALAADAAHSVCDQCAGERVAASCAGCRGKAQARGEQCTAVRARQAVYNALFGSTRHMRLP